MSKEMDFYLNIGPVYGYEKIEYGIYYSDFGIIALDRWTGEEPVELMADILSHEYIHHLLKQLFGPTVAIAIDNINRTDCSLLGNGVL